MDDIAELVDVIQMWHANKVAQLQMIIDSDDTTEIKIQGSNGNSITIDADKKKAFKWGVSIALEQFQKLPFSVN